MRPRSQSGDKEISDIDEMIDIIRLDNSFLSLPDQDSDDIAGALAASEVRDWKNIGCGCKKSNCYSNLDFNQLECLALAARKLEKIPFAALNWTAVSVDAHNCQYC